MQFFHRSSGTPRRLGVLPGAFNPVTVAHLALGEAALRLVDEVVYVLPRVFPHKEYAGAGLEQRAELLAMAIANRPAFSGAISEGGLFVEIAAECRQAYGESVRVSFLCGTDAAERIANWDYGRPEAFAQMLASFDFLVAARGGEYSPPPGLSEFFTRLEMNGTFDHVSASEVRRRMARGEPWQHLVPEAVRPRVGEIFLTGRSAE